MRRRGYRTRVKRKRRGVPRRRRVTGLKIGYRM